MRIALLLSLICGCLALAPEGVTISLALNRETLMAGNFWQLWTGHLVHFSAEHAVLDVVTLFLVTVIAEREMGRLKTGVALLIGAPLISIGMLLMAPNLMVYKGSSALAALIGFAVGSLIWRRNPHLRTALGCLGLVAITKTILDATGWSPGFTSLPTGVQVAWQAHVIACAIGAVYVAALTLTIDSRMK